eukprot:Polyplicarium_translucidae@DN4998_c0_g1_i1.p1
MQTNATNQAAIATGSERGTSAMHTISAPNTSQMGGGGTARVLDSDLQLIRGTPYSCCWCRQAVDAEELTTHVESCGNLIPLAREYSCKTCRIRWRDREGLTRHAQEPKREAPCTLVEAAYVSDNLLWWMDVPHPELEQGEDLPQPGGDVTGRPPVQHLSHPLPILKAKDGRPPPNGGGGTAKLQSNRELTHNC